MSPFAPYSAGANPWRVLGQLRTKLKMNAAAIQIPIGSEDAFEGVVDLVRWKVLKNSGEKGSASATLFSKFDSCLTILGCRSSINLIETDDIPEHLKELAEEKRQELIETVADADEELAELFIEEKPIGAQELAVSFACL